MFSRSLAIQYTLTHLKEFGKKPSPLWQIYLIVSVPDGTVSSYSRMVASSSGECPHLETTPIKFSGQFKYDTKCPMFSTYKFCSHTIAAAEVTGKLHESTQWLIKQKCAPNYSTLALHGLPKGAREKGGGTQNKAKSSCGC